MLISNKTCTAFRDAFFCRLSAGVNKAASGAAKSAAKLVNVSIKAAQRRYAVLGNQAFLGPTGVTPATGGKANISEISAETTMC